MTKGGFVLNIKTFSLFVSLAITFVIICLIQTDIFIPPELIFGIYFAGAVFDNISTYCCARVFGMQNFFLQEENINTKRCVKRFGLIWGMMITEFHPEKIFAEFLLIGAFAFTAICTIKNTEFTLFRMLTPGLLYIGSERIFAALNNFNVIRTDYKIYHLSADNEYRGET